MNRTFFTATVAAAVMLGSGAQAQSDRGVSLLAQEQQPDCAMPDSSSVVCYLPSKRELYRFALSDAASSSRSLMALPGPTASPTLKVDIPTHLWDLSVQDDGSGNTLIAWQYSRDNVNSINVVRVAKNGELDHRVVKQFKQHDPLFDLRTLLVGPNALQFFYTYYGEKQFSPILDAGSIQKLWTLTWRDGKAVSDVQLSEKGGTHTTRYDVRYRSAGTFDVAWLEERIGSVGGARRQFKIGVVSLDGGKHQLTESGAIATNELEAADRVIFPYVARSNNPELKAIAAVSLGKDGVVYKKIGPKGGVLGDVRASGFVSEFGYDTGAPPSFRYVTGSAISAPAVQAGRIEVHWTDFDKRYSVTEAQVASGSIFPRQAIADCFYWLQPAAGKLNVHKACRKA